MKKAIIFLLCIALLGGGGFFGVKQYQKSRDEKRVVDVVPVSAMAMPYYGYWGNDNSMNGYINSANAQRVKLNAQNLVKEVFVTEGQQVKKGDPILEYDMTVVELELAAKENDVRVLEQNIKMANKKLNEIRNYQPSENAPAPVEPDYPDYPDFPDEPDIPDFPEFEPLELEEEVPLAFRAASGAGTAEDPIVINCSTRATVYQPFMQMVIESKRCVELRVYTDDQTFLYKWLLNGAKLKTEDVTDWKVTDGVLIDEETGSVSIDPEGSMHGQLSFGMPPELQNQQQTEPEIPDEIPQEEPEPYIPDFPEPVNEEPTMDYMYSRAQIAQMVKEKETEIKDLNINLKQAQLELETARKQKNDGRVLAEIDGVVKKIGQVTDGVADDRQDMSETDPFAEPDINSDYFAVIEGEGDVEVICRAMEMNLDKMQPGAKLEVTSFSSNAFSEATVTSIDPEPVSYGSYGWGVNPNNSYYKVHAKLENPADFTFGYGVSVNLVSDGSDHSGSNSIYIPQHYVHKEGGDYYVMKADENDRLVKQYVNVGLLDVYVEVTGGLSMRDRICFPYGTNVKEGVRTNDTNEPLLSDKMYDYY